MQFAVKCFALFGLLAVLVVTGTAAARSNGPNDGTLTVKNADGRIVTSAFRGAVIGRFTKGQVTIKDPNPNDGIGPIVTGADSTQSLNEKTTRYSGSNVRFRMIGAPFSVTVFGTDIELSAIGRGLIQLNGTLGARGNVDDGTYAVNGGAPHPFPPFQFTFPLDVQAGG
jgi:hypothetical protein